MRQYWERNNTKNKPYQQHFFTPEVFCSTHKKILPFHRMVNWIKQHIIILLVLFSISCACCSFADAQQSENQSGVNTTWLILQSIPSLTWTSLPSQTNFAFEWEITPLLYSFGMTKLDPPWHFFKISQPERFAGSLEFDITVQLFTSLVGTSHWGFSGQLLGHLPLIERGEYLGLNIGVARYSNAFVSTNYLVGGFSTLFGFLHYNIKYSPSDALWMHSVEFRFF
jgi:hypothetical protein